MKKILALSSLILMITSMSLSSADALSLVRRARVSPTVIAQPTVYPTYTNPVYYTTPSQYVPVVPQSTNPSNGYTYYYSPTYQPGYTYSSYPTSGYYLYSNTPTTTPSPTTTIQFGRYYFSSSYVQGYAYYSYPTPGYYYYLGTTPVMPTVVPSYPQNSYNPPSNAICTIIGGVYQCTNATNAPLYSTYPGCSSSDIIIGGQAWASCNALDKNVGSTAKSGWFLAGDVQSGFVSNNGANAVLEWVGKQTRVTSWNLGPCATGYRLPTRGEWEILQSYARANGTSVVSILGLPQNNAYQATRNTNGDIVITGRLNVNAAYWSSTYAGANPIVMHIGSSYAGYNTNATEYGYVNNNGYQWTYGDGGLSLLASTTGELANVRCIRQ